MTLQEWNLTPKTIMFELNTIQIRAVFLVHTMLVFNIDHEHEHEHEHELNPLSKIKNHHCK